MIVYDFELFVFVLGAYPAPWNSLNCLLSFLLNTFGFVLSAEVILRFNRQLLFILKHYCCLLLKR